MALANISVLLSQWGYKTLIVDWDLEAPGLENFFAKYASLPNIVERHGVVDILASLAGSLSTPAASWHDDIIEVKVKDAKVPLHLLTAGRRDNGEYFKKVRDFDVQEFYLKNEGGERIEQLRREWRESYDFTLVDSRTGITDIGGICTIQLPDILVMLFTATGQGLTGTINVARRALSARKELPFDRMKLLTVPIASRLDVDKEFELSQRWLSQAAERLAELYADWLPMNTESLDILQLTKIPYKAYFSFEERLAVMEESKTDRASLRDAYATLAALLASELRDADELLRSRDNYVNMAAEADIIREGASVYISYAPGENIDWLSRLRERLADELRLDTGEEFSVFLDRVALSAGDNFEKERNNSLEAATFLMPVITPGYFYNDRCRAELEKFIQREQQLRRNDLIYPVYYVTAPLLEDRELAAKDELAMGIASRQLLDWRGLQFEPLNSPKVEQALVRLATRISESLHQIRSRKSA